jgi:hypothetical protein
MPIRWWAAALSPVAFLGVALALAWTDDDLPPGSDFGRYSGLPSIGIVPVVVMAIFLALGEETGWRGFVLPLLQRNGTGGASSRARSGTASTTVGVGTAGATSTLQAVTSAFVYSQALVLVGLELRARARGDASILAPRGAKASPVVA